MTTATIVHPVRACAPCQAALRDGADVQLYHFGFSDGHNVSISHGCEHFIRGMAIHQQTSRPRCR